MKNLKRKEDWTLTWRKEERKMQTKNINLFQGVGEMNKLQKKKKIWLTEEIY